MSSTEPGRLTPAESYERVFVPTIFAPLSKVVVDLAAPAGGERVLDLACGTGIVARTVAPLIGADGSVVGVDLRPGMLAVAGSVPAPPGAEIEWREGDATALDLPDGSFDLALCQQGLQFFEEPAAAAREVFRVLVPDGRFVVAVWERAERQPLYEEMAEIELRHLAQHGVTYEDLVTPFSWPGEDALRELLEEAGFDAVELSNTSIVADFAADTFIDDVEYSYSAIVEPFVEDPSAFRAFVEAVTVESKDLLDRYREGDRIRLEMPTHLASARRPT